MPNTELVGWAAGVFSLAAFFSYNLGRDEAHHDRLKLKTPT